MKHVQERLIHLHIQRKNISTENQTPDYTENQIL